MHTDIIFEIIFPIDDYKILSVVPCVITCLDNSFPVDAQELSI